MYERFISSSMLTGIRFCGLDVLIRCAYRVEYSWRRGSDVEIPDIERVVLDELAARLHLVAHQRREHLIGFGVVFSADLKQRAMVRVHRGVPQRIGVHLAQALVAVDSDALLAGGDEEFHEL